MEKIILNTDGGARGNPGPAGAGAVVTGGTGQVLAKASKYLGETTNNEAEYQGVILGLETIKKNFSKDKLKNLQVEVRLDSELVTRQLLGQYQVKEERLWPWFMKINNFRVSDFPNISFTHVPREANAVADELANEAMDKQTTGGLFN
ncbi:MAG: hypothetical protein A2589_02845 [Candidatus Vogelbacteria bacterium RIFOXYD1_FULL_46_19]|uniref:RNase H type-1 domain-containing protein n=1 Tax=Candidatus Vogelbacteria bacterium RIFOXYD1_FULL_46_19 TaxID=1802439 RepID=A0A1G2QGQ7_9BACT|nr:MAG: hypothetical protein A2589_02845 [Candidatus Vogelbacteria bacterium RIFOXYD1_FULL_46_19]